MKRRAPPECLHRPQSKDSSAVFPFDPWGSVSLSIDLEREGKERKKEQGEREREREERCSGDSAYSPSKLALGKDDDLE